MSVTFSQWRDEALQRVRRLISILSSAEGEEIDAQESSLTWFYINVELKYLQELVDTPPHPLQSDAMIGLLRLRRLCKTLPVFCDETESVDEFCKRVNLFLDDLSSPAGIDRIEKIATLLSNAEPWDAAENAKPPEAPQASQSDPGGGTANQSIPLRENPPAADPVPGLGVAGKATAAAYELHKSGVRVSVAAVAKRADIDRSNLYAYPEVIKLIKTLATPDRSNPTGRKDRDGSCDAVDDGEYLNDDD